jgi:type I restriction-modification system DNA methylase subunit
MKPLRLGVNMSETASLGLSTDEEGFIETVIDEYAAIYEQIEIGERDERDVMPRLVRNLFIEALGFDASKYEQENDWNDIRLYDDDHNPVIIVEGKNRDLNAEKGIDQAFEYTSRTNYIRYLIATNLDRLLLYRRCDPSEADETRYGVSAKKIADIEFKGIINKVSGSALVDELTLDERQSIQQLMQIRAQEISDPDRYDNFEIYGRQDVSTDEGFEELIQSLSVCLDYYLTPYTLSAFDEYEERYQEFRSQADDLENQIERLRNEGHEDSEIAELEVELGNLRDEYYRYREFQSDFDTWVNLSNRQDNGRDENKLIFCRESVYVQINKILLIRIAEDQGLTNRMISNGGVNSYFDFWDDYSRYTKRDYTDLFDFACEELSEVYDHLYTQQIFDWNLQDGTQLNKVIQRTFWHLNHYDFSDVSRDVLGHLYEEHLSPEERKELGEFYTPTSVVDFILDQVGYTADKQLELPKYDLLDPACGSGTFLVRAATRLRKRLSQKGVGPRESIEIIQKRLHGFDINPFATHICEMNLLFQVVDLYRDVKEQDEDFTLDRFQIYQTDSLRTETQTSLSTVQSNFLQRKYQEEKQQAYQVKNREDYGFVVGNPPYVRIQNLPDGPARQDYDEYYSAYYNYDLYCLFVERAAGWLDEGGQLGFIISNKFVQSRYGERLREFIEMNYQPETLINFTSVDVFQSAKAFPLIFTAKRINKEVRERTPDEFVIDDYYFSYGKVTDTFSQLVEAGYLRGWTDVEDNGDSDTATIPKFLNAIVPTVPGEAPPNRTEVLEGLNIPVEELEYTSATVYPVSSDMISGSDWRFVSAREEEAMKAIEAGGQNLASYCNDENVERGLRTGANDVFVVTEATIEEYGLEEELIHPLVGGKEVERWYSPWKDQYVIYTRNDTEIDEYPNTKSYFEDHRDDLEDRYCVKVSGEPWYAIDKIKKPELFERPKVITPDIVLYNNFWLDESEKFYCLDTTYYAISNGDTSEWYLLGLLNSDAVQFWYRRVAPTYKDDFPRYKSEYLQKIPIPDPESADSELVSKVESLASNLQDQVAEYHDSEAILADPLKIFDRNSIDQDSISLAEYVDSMSLSDGDISDTYCDDMMVQLNVQDKVECTSESAAEAFHRFIEIMGFDSVSEIKAFDVPRTDDGLKEFVDAFEKASSGLGELEQEIIQSEKKLNKGVYQLFGLSDEMQEYIAENVKRPTTPIHPKAMSK